MKKTLILLSLLLGFNSYALICTSDDNPAYKLKVTKLDNSLIEAESYARTVDQIYVGTVEYSFVNGEVYTLFNQEGEMSLLEIKKEINLGAHCRTRLCGTTADLLNPSIGKLSVEGKEDVYFNCF